MSISFLVHHPADSVGVAVKDIETPGTTVGGFRDAETTLDLDIVEPVPLGHKVALCDLAKGTEVIEYGVAIGVATADISMGQLVHTHNLRGQRWA